jgi:hypothetical protein
MRVHVRARACPTSSGSHAVRGAFPQSRSRVAAMARRDGTSAVKEVSCALSELLSGEDCSCCAAASCLPELAAQLRWCRGRC